jgi:hypothetical protein
LDAMPKDPIGSWTHGPEPQYPTLQLWEHAIQQCNKTNKTDSIWTTKEFPNTTIGSLSNILDPKELNNADSWDPVKMASSESGGPESGGPESGGPESGGPESETNSPRSMSSNFISAVHHMGHEYSLGMLARISIKGLWKSNVTNNQSTNSKISRSTQNRYIWKAKACFSNQRRNISEGTCYLITMLQDSVGQSSLNLTKLASERKGLDDKFKTLSISPIGCLSDSIMYMR